MGDETVWIIEKRLWTEGASAWRESLDPLALMVLPEPAGIMRASAARASVEDAPRWAQVEMSERTLVRPTHDLIVIAYRARGRREDGSSYEALCGSTYRLADDRWRMVQHQQTPISGA